MVTGGPRHSRRRAPARGPLFTIALGGLIGLIVALLAVIEFLHIPYYELSPGPTSPVSQLITVPKSLRHPVHGSLLLVTVYQTNLSPLQYWRAELDSQDQVLSAAAILGPLPASELQQEDLDEMTASKEDAEVAALRRLGYPVTEHGTGALIDYVLSGTPAASTLVAGETITAVGGHPIHTINDLTTALAGRRPGQRVTLDIATASGRDRTVILTLGRRPGAASQAFIGVGVLTRDDRFDLPFPVDINSSGIGGPSAGLSFTLGIINELTTGRLTGGHVMAATGTIDEFGNVGDVGGVAQKTVSVTNAGATLFLVPPQEYATAKAHAGPHLKVVAVSTLDQAIRAIGANGGDIRGIPPAPPGFQ